MNKQPFPPVPLEAVKRQIAELRKGPQLRHHLSTVQFNIFGILQFGDSQEPISPQRRQALGHQTVVIGKTIQCIESPLGQNPTVLDDLARTPGLSYFKKHLNQLKKLPQCDPDWVDLLFAFGWQTESFGMPPLYLLTDDALRYLFNLVLNRPDLSLDAVRKARQRIGFKRHVTPSIKSVLHRKGMIHFIG